MADLSMMAEKWVILFRLLDINKDGVITSADRDTCTDKCPDVYGNDAKIVDNINVFWDSLVFPSGEVNWNNEMKQEDFLATYAKYFMENKFQTVQRVKFGLQNLLQVIDNDGAGIVTFDKFFKFHTVFGLAHEVIVRTTFNLIGPDADDTCPLDRVQAYYEELFVGEDQKQFTTLKNAFRPFGMS